MANRNSLIGQTFSRLTVLEDAGTDRLGNTISLVECTCGNIKIVKNYNLINGSTKSCGCIQREKASNNLKEYWKDKPRKVYPPKRYANPGRPPIATEIRENVAEAIKAGISYRMIAMMYPVTIGTISKIAREYGIDVKRGTK